MFNTNIIKKRKLDMTRTDRYMSRRVPAINIMGILFSVIFGLTFSYFAATIISEWFVGYFDAIFGISCAIVAGVFIPDTFTRYSAMQEMKKGKTRTLATVIDRYVEESYDFEGDSVSMYYIIFRFIAVEKEWIIKTMVCQELYDITSRGVLPMIYANSDPRCILFEGEY